MDYSTAVIGQESIQPVIYNATGVLESFLRKIDPGTRPNISLTALPFGNMSPYFPLIVRQLMLVPIHIV